MEDCLSNYNLLLPPGKKVLREQNVCEKKKIVKLTFVNWTSKSERIVELKMANEQCLFICGLCL